MSYGMYVRPSIARVSVGRSEMLTTIAVGNWKSTRNSDDAQNRKAADVRDGRQAFRSSLSSDEASREPAITPIRDWIAACFFGPDRRYCTFRPII